MPDPLEAWQPLSAKGCFSLSFSLPFSESLSVSSRLGPHRDENSCRGSGVGLLSPSPRPTPAPPQGPGDKLAPRNRDETELHSSEGTGMEKPCLVNINIILEQRYRILDPEKTIVNVFQIIMQILAYMQTLIDIKAAKNK